MNRTPIHCKNKWSSMEAKKLKKGPFTAEEDDIIKQRVAELGYNGDSRGLWASLEQALGRPATTIIGRWDVLDPEFNHGPWSREEVCM